jgi:N-acetylmuramoyl-L-alanine amidase
MPNPLLPGLQLQPLPYEDRLPLRDPATLEMVVIHCTELPDLAMAREYGERVLYDSGAGNSGHFYIDRDGSVVQYVAPERVAHHVRGMNAHTLGIELVNTGRYPDWFDSRHQAMDEAYTEAQLEALERLLLALVARYPSLRRIAGHDQLDREQVPASDDPTLTVARASVIRGRCSRGRGCWRRCRCSRLGKRQAAPCTRKRQRQRQSAGIPWDGGVGPVAGTP